MGEVATLKTAGLDLGDLFGGRKVEAKPEPLYSVSDMPGEFRGEADITLKPLFILSDAYPDRTLTEQEIKANNDFTNQTQKYLAVTHETESGSERTRILGQYAKKMLQGEVYKGDVQVVILNRGLTEKGFILPDGTIVLSQSLINRSGSFSAALGIIAHEVAHLINGTYVSRESISTEWVHELGADAEVSRLLDKVGINTLVAHDFFERQAKESLNQRTDLGHQSPLMRASLPLIEHQFINRKFSSADIIPLDKVALPDGETISFYKQEIKPTNREIAEMWPEGLVEGNAAELLDKLHSQDLCQLLDNGCFSRGDLKDSEAFQQALTEFLRKRTTDVDLLPLDQDSLLLTMWWGNERWRQHAFSNHTYQDYLKILKHGHTIDPKQWRGMNYRIFGVYARDNWPGDWDGLYARQTDIDAACEGQITFLINQGVAIKENTFLEIIEAYVEFTRQDKDEQFGKYWWHVDPIISTYIAARLFDPKTQRVDQKELRQLLQKIAKTGYSPASDTWLLLENALGTHQIFRNKKGDIDSDRVTQLTKDQLEPIFLEVFGVNLYKEQLESEPAFFSLEQVSRILNSIFSEKEVHVLYRKFSNLRRLLYSNIQLAESHPLATEIRKHYAPIITYLREQVRSADFTGLDFDPQIETERETSTLFSLDEKGKVLPSSLKMRLEAFIANLEVDTYPSFKAYEEKRQVMVDSLHYMEKHYCSDFDRLSLNDQIWHVLNFSYWFGDQTLYMGEKLATSPLHLSFQKKLEHTYQIESFVALDQALADYNERIDHAHYLGMHSHYRSKKIFSSNLAGLIFYPFFEGKFIDFLHQDIDSEVLPAAIQAFENIVSGIGGGIDMTDASPDLSRKIHDLRLAYIISAESNPEKIRSRMDYFLDNYHKFSYSDLLVLMKQVKHYDDAKYFFDQIGLQRMAVLRGDENSWKLDALAIGDLVVSLFKDKQLVVGTIADDPLSKLKYTTDLAKTWLGTFIAKIKTDDTKPSSGIQFDRQLRKVIIDPFRERDRFRTVKDVIQGLQGLSEGAKKGLMMRLLLDSDGLLATTEKRQWLADLVVKSFNIEDDFVKQVAKGLIIEGKPSLVGLGLSQLLGPLLFSGLDLQAINYTRINKEFYKRGSAFSGKPEYSYLPNLFSESRDNIVEIGSILRGKTGLEALSKLYQASTSHLRRLHQWLEAYTSNFNLTQKYQEVEAAEQSGLSPRTESFIQGIESMGSLFVRSLQIAQLVYDFEPKLAKRLSNAFDRMQPTDEFKLWLNLHKEVEDDKSGDAETSLSLFVGEMLDTIDEFLGGGSLASAYKVSLTPKGIKKLGVKTAALKMYTANAAAFVDISYDSTIAALRYAEKHGNEQTKKHAQLAQIVLGVARHWSKADLKDNKPQWGAILRQAIKAISEKIDKPIITAKPLFATPDNHIRVEEYLAGSTLNRYLQNRQVSSYLAKNKVPFDSKNFNQWLENQDNLSEDIKTTLKALHIVLGFVDSFFETPVGVDVGQYIFPQDPHPGNFIISKDGTLGAIDLHTDFSFSKQIG